MRICLVSRELYPFAGGGIAPIVTAAAQQLADHAEVVVVTSADHEAEYHRLRAADDHRILPDSVRMLFVPEPHESFGGAVNYMHAYSARVHDVLRAHYAERGPDVLEFCDYLGEGFVTIQARHTEADWLADTLVCVRIHTTSEFCSVLDGFVDDTFEVETLFEAERYCLRHADHLLWSGGDVLETYRRIYGPDRLAPGIELPDAFLDETRHVPDRTGGPADGAPVRMLYLGRMERRKGIHDLVRGLLDTGRDDWRLTLVGGDTDTGPLGTSLDEQLRLTAAEDPRITFMDPVPRAEVGRLIDEHDVMVIPSRWECWPNVGREALQHNRPILGTPVGGLTAMVRPGVSGWLAAGTGRRALRDAAIELLDDREHITELIGAGGPRSVFDELTDGDRFLERYLALGRRDRPRPAVPTATDEPLVSVVVPYYRLPELVERTLDSVAAQTYGRIETIVVNDGSLRPEDQEVLARITERPDTVVVTQTNAGLGAARNFGISQARGALVLPLDADDLIAPELVARLVTVLQRRPELAYAGTWVQYMDEDEQDFGGDIEGYMPMGNWTTAMRRNNVAGVCTCLFRRSVFDGLDYDDEMTSYEDWLLFREMQDAGLLGAIVPERLFRYRVRTQSMTRQIARPSLERLMGDFEARRLERAWRWEAGEAVPRPARTPAPTDAVPGHGPGDALDELRAANARLAAVPHSSRGAAAASALRRQEIAR